MSTVLDGLKKVRQTGDLWASPWWGDAQYYINSKITRQEADLSFQVLRSVFTTEWASNYVGYLANAPTNEQLAQCHPVVYWILTQGIHSFQHSFLFGSDLSTLRNANLLDKDLINRLRDAHNFPGAEFEVKIIAHFIREKFRVERDFPSGKGNKNCDIKISKEKGGISEYAFIEITRPEDVCYENKKRYAEGMAQLARSLGAGEEESIRDVLREIGQGEYALSEAAEIKKIISKMEEKAAQLPNNGPGLIVIYTPMALAPRSSMGLFEAEVDTLLQTLPVVSAVVLFEAYFVVGFGIRYQTNVFLNPGAAIDLSTSETMNAIEHFS